MKNVLTCISCVLCSSRLGSDRLFWDIAIEEVDQLSFVIISTLRSDLWLFGAACEHIQKQITFRAVQIPENTSEFLLLSHIIYASIKWRIPAWDTHTHDCLFFFYNRRVSLHH